MNRFTCACGLFALAAFSTAAAENLIANGGFERVNEKGALLDWGRPPKAWTVGEGLGAFDTRGAMWSGVASNACSIRAKSPVLKAGKKYKVSVWMRGEKVEHTRPGAYLEWYGTDGHWKGGAYVQGDDGTSDWREYSAYTTLIPTGIVSTIACVWVAQGTKGKVWIDNFSITELPEATAVDGLFSNRYRNIGAEGKVTFKAALNKREGAMGFFTHRAFANPKFTSPVRVVPKDGVAEWTMDISDLAMGENVIRFALYEAKEGKVMYGSKEITFTRVTPEAERAMSVRIDEYGRAIVEGKPFFPLGMYWMKVNEKELKVYANGPFNCLMPYITPNMAAMDLCQQYGVKVIYNVVNGYPVRADRPVSSAQLEKHLRTLKRYRNHPALFAWYVNDEMPISLRDGMNSARQLVEDMDPNHPTWIAICQHDQVREYLSTSDVIGTDPYPLFKNPINMVTTWTRNTRKGLMGMKPMWQIPQVFNKQAYAANRKTPKICGAPSEAEVKNMAWQCLAGGANGLIFYSFFDLVIMDKEDGFLKRFNEVKRVAEEIKRYERFFLTTDPEPVVESANGALAVRAWRCGGETLVAAVNTSREPLKAKVCLGGASAIDLTFNLPPIGVELKIIGEKQKSVNRCVYHCSEDWEFREDGSPVWRQVQIPHDATFDRQPVKRPELGEHGYVEGGRFFYRKAIATPAGATGSRLSLRFEGVYYDSSVYVNGVVAGGRKSGYLPFEVPLDSGRLTNLVEVTVNAMAPSSRWNPGAGILRNVSLIARRNFSLEPEQVFVRTVSADAERAVLQVSVEGAEIVSPKGGRLVIEKPRLWSPEDPFLYDIKIVARGSGGEDSLTIPFGIRTIEFTKDRGFFLNGRHYPIRGVCQHEGGPCFGPVYNAAALEYSLRELKKLGVNAIRTVHHPFPPEFYDLCDQLGFLVKNELFDQWREPKSEYGVSTFFESEWRRDVETSVRRDRNHPCVILWSIGNEIPELGAAQYGGRHGHDGAKTAMEMREAIQKLDPTHPITAGLNGPQWAEEHGIMPALDVCGLNYKAKFYDLFRGKYALFGSETAATYSLRDTYFFRTNGEELVVSRHEGNMADAHSMIPVWGTPEMDQEATLKRQISAPWSAGEFTWCSFDYLGEGSNPLSKGQNHWPCLGSSWGMYDFAGLPKDRAYLYQAMWTDKPMAHLLPDWTLPGSEGKRIPVWCYTNAEEAELFVNGVSQGVRRRADTSDLHLAWSVPYAPGVLRVEARRQGKAVAVDERKTAGRKAAIRRTVLFERGDVRLVRFDAVDKDGNRVISCEDEIEIDSSEGEVLAAANGSPLERTNRRARRRRLFRGSLAAWLRRCDSSIH